MQYGPVKTQESPPQPHSLGGRDWHIRVMALAVALLVASGVLVYVFGSSTSRTPRARLENALVATNSAVTTDLTMAVKANFDGLTVSILGTGAVDFATKAMSLQMSVFGQSISFVETGGLLYLDLGKQVSAQFPGKTWVRMPVSAFASPNDTRLLFTSDPQALMSSLLRLGATITPIGTASIDGTQDQGYVIHLSARNLESHLSDLPASIRPLFATSSIPKSAELSTTVYVNPAGQLQALHVLLSAPATGHQATASIDLTMSHFGAASVRAAPPATQTVTYKQLKGPLGSNALPFTARSSA
jgi:hypothetical protein